MSGAPASGWIEPGSRRKLKAQAQLPAHRPRADTLVGRGGPDFSGILGFRRENCSCLLLPPPEPEAEKECAGLQLQLLGLFTKPGRCDTRGWGDGWLRGQAHWPLFPKIWVPSIAAQTICNFGSRGSGALCWPLRAIATRVAGVDTPFTELSSFCQGS